LIKRFLDVLRKVSYFEKGAFWQKQTHLYEKPFYMIDYALAQVCALQIYAKLQIDFDAASQDYLKICKEGGRLSFLEIVKLGGLKNPFLPETLENVFANYGL
jgi:oligoendopeptidase F